MAPPPVSTLPGYSTAGPWFYNKISGKVAYAPGPFGYGLFTHLPLGWYGFKTQADLDSAVKIEGWPAPTTNPVKGATNTLTGGAGVAGDILGLPTFKNTRGLAVRVLKVIAGLVLIIVGFVQLTHATTAISSAAKVAGAVA